jgi:hypothetical protein
MRIIVQYEKALSRSNQEHNQEVKDLNNWLKRQQEVCLHTEKTEEVDELSGKHFKKCKECGKSFWK